MTELSEQPSDIQTIERDELASAFREVFRTVSGKRVLFFMLEQCAVYRDAFTGNDAATNYTLGMQAAGRRLMAKMDDIDPRMYPALLIDMASIREADAAFAASRAKQGGDDAVDA